MEPHFYDSFVKSLRLGEIEREVLELRPSIFILQDLYLCPEEQRADLLESIKYRHLSQLEYYDISNPSSLLKFKSGNYSSDWLNRTGLLKDGLLRYDKDGNIIFGS